MNKSLLSFTFLCVLLSQVTYTHSIDEMLENAHNTKLLNEKVNRFRKLNNYGARSVIGVMVTGLAGMFLGLLSENNKVFKSSMVLFFTFVPVGFIFQKLQEQEMPTVRDFFILLAALKTDSDQFILNNEDFIFLGSKAAHFSKASLRYIAHKLGRNIPNL